MSLLDKILKNDLFKARHGIYADTAENRRLHRVGQEYGHAAKEEVPGPGRKPARQGDEQKNPLGAKLDSLSATQLSKLVDATEKRIQEFKDKGYEQGVQKLEEVAREARKRLMGDEAYGKKDLIQRVRESVLGKKSSEEIEQEWEDKIRYYISNHYPTQATVTAETNSDKGREERARMKKDPKLKRMLEQADREFKEADKREQAEREGGGEKPDIEPSKKPKTDKKSESTGSDVKVEARMTFNDIPMSGKVNMTKYLSDKRRNKVDGDFQSIKNLDRDTIQTLHDGLVSKFNEEFDGMSKADRAEALYKIARVKDALQKNGGVNKKASSEDKVGSVKVEHIDAENLSPGDRVYNWGDVDEKSNKPRKGAKPEGIIKKVEKYRNGFGEVIGAKVTYDDGQVSVHRGTLLVDRPKKK